MRRKISKIIVEFFGNEQKHIAGGKHKLTKSEKIELEKRIEDHKQNSNDGIKLKKNLVQIK